jgi:putative DNA primase/helicase
MDILPEHGGNTPPKPTSPPLVTFSIGEYKKPVGKRFYLKDGVCEKESSANFATANYRPVTVPLNEFGEHFTKPNQFCVFGIPKGVAVGETGKGLVRNNQTFAWPDDGAMLCLIDVDLKEGCFPPMPKKVSAKRIIATIDLALKSMGGKGLDGVAHLVRPSSSTGICYEDGRPATPEGSQHIYIPITGATPAEFLAWLNASSIISGVGFCTIDKDGGDRVVSIFDPSVGVARGLDFTGPPRVEKGLIRKKQDDLYVEGGVLDLAGLNLSVDQKQLEKAKARLKSDPEYAPNIARLKKERNEKWVADKIADGMDADTAKNLGKRILTDSNRIDLYLDDDIRLVFDEKGAATIWEVFSNLPLYEKQTLADPFDDAVERCKACLYWNKGDDLSEEKVLINSLKHGGTTYFLHNHSKPIAVEPQGAQKTKEPASGGVVLQRLDEIEIEPIRWIWNGYLAKGKLHLIAGHAGVSKTTLALKIGATITTEGSWPDGTKAALGNVLIWSGEDDPQDTIAPRLLVNGADPNRVYVIAGAKDSDGKPRPFDPAEDMGELAKRANAIEGGVSLLIVDPIVSAVKGDSHKNAEVRRDLQSLVDLGVELDCAVVGITHLSKGSKGARIGERVTGSLAFNALARVVWGCAQMPEEKNQDGMVAMFVSKSNIGPDKGGWLYDIDQKPVPGKDKVYATQVTWRGPTSESADELMAMSEDGNPQDKPKIEIAKEFLHNELGDTPRKASDVEDKAKAKQISGATLWKARKAMGVMHEKWGFGENSITWWHLKGTLPKDWEEQRDKWQTDHKSSLFHPVSLNSKSMEKKIS